ncbi:MAG: carbon storage regulator [Fuerstiella sp.]
MLVLSRGPNQTVVIEGGIRVTVLELRGGKVRLGFDAPRSIGIWRGELDISHAGDRRSGISKVQKDRLIAAISEKTAALSKQIDDGAVHRSERIMEQSEALYMARGVVSKFLDKPA